MRRAEDEGNRKKKRVLGQYAHLGARAEAQAPPRAARGGLEGLEAAMAEYAAFKAAGMEREWRERWKAYLRPAPS